MSQEFGGIMMRLLPLAVLCVVASATAPGAQAPSGLERVATVVLAGRAFSSGATQEAVMLGVPWTNLAYQLSPRQKIRIRAEYFSATSKIAPITEDARQQRFDFEGAKFLFSKSFSRGRPKIVLVADLGRPEVKRGMYWLRDQLKQLNLSVDDVVIDQKDVNMFLDRARDGEGFLALRLDR